MLVQLDNPKILSDAISIISEIVNEVRIKLNEDGMSIIAVDPANVAMVIFRIPKESFSHYEAGKEVWGVNLEDFKKVMKRASTSTSMAIEQEENQLKISMFDKAKRNFILSLVDVSSEDKSEPQLNFSCEVEMGSQEFAQAIEDCTIVADSGSFIGSPESFTLEGKGSLNSARAEFSSDHIQIKGAGKSKYSLEYLNKFTKAKSLSEKVILKFSDDYPLRMDFAGNRLGMGFILAPRVEND